jgi:hypothetical protein
MTAVNVLQPQDRRQQESAPPPDWTIFRRDEHEAPRGILASLEDLTGWTAETIGLEGAAFGLTPALPLWGEATTFVDYPPSAGPASLTLRPPQSLPLSPGSDFLELWVKGDFFDCTNRPPDFALDVLLVAGSGAETFLRLDHHIAWPTYSLRNVQIPAALRPGARVTGIRLSGHDPAKPHRFGLDCLCAYREELKPLALAPRPKRNLTLPEGHSPGLHTGPGFLPFPTREETILPDNLTVPYRNLLRKDGGAFVFHYRAQDVELRYRWTPQEDPFRVAIDLDGQAVGQAMTDVFMAGTDALVWFDALDWPGPFAREPLPPEALRAIPEKLMWAEQTLDPATVDGDTVDFVYDPVRFGCFSIQHTFRYLHSATECEVELGFGADWGLGIWVNGDLLSDRLDGCGCIVAGTIKVKARLKPGRNLVICRVIERKHLHVLNVSPLPPDVRWDGPWHVFGPTINKRFRLKTAAPLTFRKARAAGKSATAWFDSDDFGPVEIAMRIWGKSLVVNLAARSGRIGVLDQGVLTQLTAPEVFEAPPMEDNALLRVKAGERTVFISHLLDWYRSNATRPVPLVSAAGDRARLLGQMYYLPLTDGRHNPLFERFFLTCSPVYEEVLPNIPNPASPWAVEAGRYVYRQSMGPEHIEPALAKARQWQAYGMTKILYLHHEAGWEHVDPATELVNDGCTLRTEVSPHKGGNEAVRAMLAELQSMGLRTGLYTNYQDFYPLNSRFVHDQVLRLSDGSLRRAWVHSYALKPALAVEYDAQLAPRIAQQFHPDAAYTDVHTCVPPWDLVDCDARVPGAGTFAATYYAYGEMLLNDQRLYCGPVISEGFYHWIYAGLVSGNYGQLGHFGHVGYDPLGPLDPAFNLLKIHPLESDVGIGVYPDYILTCRGEDQIEAGNDRYLCATLAYGHIAYLPDDRYGIRLLLRVYHLARAASACYAGAKPLAIHCEADDGRWLDLSEVHAKPLANTCRLRVAYPRERVLYINWDWERRWAVRDRRAHVVTLPPNGFLFEGPAGIVCASLWNGAVRQDMAQTPEGWFVDGRGQEVEYGPLAARGSAALLVPAARPGCYRLIDGGGNDTFRIAFAHASAQAIAFNEKGERLAETSFAKRGKWSVLAAVPNAVRYEW